MTLLERRRAMMSRKAEPEWDYVLTRKNSSGGIIQQLINVKAGQKIVIRWQNRTSSYTYCLWGLENGATFAETPKANMPTHDIPKSGQYTYTVTTDGLFIAAGLRSTSPIAAYYFRGDWVKVRIIG